MISTYTDQYVFNSTDMPIHRYISPLYINTCLRHTIAPVSVIFDASSRGSSSGPPSLEPISHASGSDFGPHPLVTSFYLDPEEDPDNCSDDRSCALAAGKLDHSDDYESLHESYQEYLREPEEEGQPKKKLTEEEEQERKVIKKIKDNIRETNEQYEKLDKIFYEIYNRKKNIDIKTFLG